MAGPLLYRRGTEAGGATVGSSRPPNDTRATATLIDASLSFGALEGTTQGAVLEYGGAIHTNYPDPITIDTGAYVVYWYWDDVPADMSIYVYVRPTVNEHRRRYFGAAIVGELPTDVHPDSVELENKAVNGESVSQNYGFAPCMMTTYYSTGGPATLYVYSFDASIDDNHGTTGTGYDGPIDFRIGWGFSDDPNPSHWLPSETSTSPAGTLVPEDEPGGTTNNWSDWLLANGYRVDTGWPTATNFHPDRVWGWKYTSTTGDLPTEHWLPYYGFDFWS